MSQGYAKLLGHAFRQLLWKAFGAHLGEEKENEEREKRRKDEEASWAVLG